MRDEDMNTHENTVESYQAEIMIKEYSQGNVEEKMRDIISIQDSLEQEGIV